MESFLRKEYRKALGGIFAILFVTAGFGFVLSEVAVIKDYLVRFSSLSFTVAALLIAAASIGEKLSSETVSLIIDSARLWIFSGTTFLVALAFSYETNHPAFLLFSAMGLISLSLGIVYMFTVAEKLAELKEQ